MITQHSRQRLTHIALHIVYPQPGWHEHDPSTYTVSIDECIRECLKEFESLGYSKDMLKGVGIATQRETTVVWDRETGRPICNASECQRILIRGSQC